PTQPTNTPRLQNSSLSRYGGPREPHSFPTRRSSDLEPEEAKAAEAGLDFELGDLTFDDTPTAEADNVLEFSQPERAEEADQSELDRKSTRLNSSHVKISYAVFCLKKKKKQTHGGGTK